MTVTLHLGDGLEVMRGMPAGSVDAVVTDPPYSSGGAYRGDRMGSTVNKYVQTGSADTWKLPFTGDNRDQRGFLIWCAMWMGEARRVTKYKARWAIRLLYRLAATTNRDRRYAMRWLGMARDCYVVEARYQDATRTFFSLC